MFQFLESPIFIFSFLTFSSLFLFVLFLLMLSRANGEPRARIDSSMKVTEENEKSECAIIGFVRALPQGEPLPDECISCPKLLKCMVARDAFDWYTGRKSPQESQNGGRRANRSISAKHEAGA